VFGLRVSHIIYVLEQNGPMGGDTTVNRMGIRGVLNGPVDRHPPGIDSFRIEGVSFI
jgi:hypothetical protein